MSTLRPGRANGVKQWTTSSPETFRDLAHSVPDEQMVTKIDNFDTRTLSKIWHLRSRPELKVTKLAISNHDKAEMLASSAQAGAVCSNRTATEAARNEDPRALPSQRCQKMDNIKP